MRAIVCLAAGILAGSAVRVGFTGHVGGPGPAVTVTAGYGIEVPGYLIPETGTVYEHVNATDLNNGTAHIGTAWTEHGTVTFNAGSPASVGPFSDSNYFTLAPGNPINVTSIFTAVLVVNIPSAQGSAVPLATGTNGSGGFYLFTYNLGGNYLTINQPTASQPFTPFSLSAGIGVILCGWDGALGWIQVNGHAAGVLSSTAPASSATSAYLGRYTSTGDGFSQGDVVELMVSSSAPSQAAFTAIYQAIEDAL